MAAAKKNRTNDLSRPAGRRGSRRVMRTSNTLYLESGIFTRAARAP